jgi:MtN3 and saliva related transmembrane protein
MNQEILGLAAGTLTSASALPQLVKMLKTKKAEDLSYVFFGALVTGLALWVAYGIVRRDVPIIATNAFSCAVNTFVLILTYKYKRHT